MTMTIVVIMIMNKDTLHCNDSNDNDDEGDDNSDDDDNGEDNDDDEAV